jgi:hypothetical protein
MFGAISDYFSAKKKSDYTTVLSYEMLFLSTCSVGIPSTCSRLAPLDPLGLVSIATVRQRWCLQSCGGVWRWAASMMVHDGASRAGLRVSGEIPTGLADANTVVAPVVSAGATLPS